MTIKATLSGQPPTLPTCSPTPRTGTDAASGLHEDYWILSEPERAKGFVRPLRFAYRHSQCGLTTSMATAIAETYARDPGFYSHTYCAHCRSHRPVAEFHWPDSDEIVGS